MLGLFPEMWTHLTDCKPEKTVSVRAPEETQAILWSGPETWYWWLVCLVASSKMG